VGSFDTVTWQALTVVLTALGLIGSVAFWRLRGPVAGMRMLAVALLPAAAYLTGTLRLCWEIGAAVVRWATRLAFGPVMWLGVGVALTSLLLFVLAGALGRRGVPGRGHRRGALPEPSPRGSGPGTGTTKAGPVEDDMADIEAILKRHGIS
jgi:hypothetical protein